MLPPSQACPNAFTATTAAGAERSLPGTTTGALAMIFVALLLLLLLPSPQYGGQRYIPWKPTRSFGHPSACPCRRVLLPSGKSPPGTLLLLMTTTKVLMLLKSTG